MFTVMFSLNRGSYWSCQFLDINRSLRLARSKRQLNRRGRDRSARGLPEAALLANAAAEDTSGDSADDHEDDANQMAAADLFARAG